MKETIKKQIDELIKKKKEKLEKTRELSKRIRELAKEIILIRKKFGLRKGDDIRKINKKIEEIELKISTESLPLDIEREYAKRIEKLENKKKRIIEIEEKKSSIAAYEEEIRKLKEERKKLKKEIDLDKKELDQLWKELRTVEKREAGKFEELSLAEIATLKKIEKDTKQ